MTATAILKKEIENLTEETAAEVLDFVLFLGSRRVFAVPRTPKTPTVKSLFGSLPGLDTDIEKDRDEEEDRV